MFHFVLILSIHLLQCSLTLGMYLATFPLSVAQCLSLIFVVVVRAICHPSLTFLTLLLLFSRCGEEIPFHYLIDDLHYLALAPPTNLASQHPIKFSKPCAVHFNRGSVIIESTSMQLNIQLKRPITSATPCPFDILKDIHPHLCKIVY